MKSYLNHNFSPDDPDLMSVIDDLPLWAAPFGLKLLDTVRLKPGINVLDVGCGLGFPIVELAQRLGKTGRVVGLDLWEAALNRARRKLDVYSIGNAGVALGDAERMPFANETFDLVVSNNGISNVENLSPALNECYRVSKPGARFVMTYNLEDTMIEFYSVFEAVLAARGNTGAVARLKKHIHDKRKPLDEMKEQIGAAGFEINSVEHGSFRLDFADAATMFDHALIKYWFLPPWKEIAGEDHPAEVFDNIEQKLNAIAAEKGEIGLTVPHATIGATSTRGATRSGIQSEPRVQFDKVRSPGAGLNGPVTITIVYDNYSCEAGIETGRGFSCCVEGAEQNILFDTGTRSELFMRNLGETGIDPRSINTVFLSHEHGDHTAGLFALLDVNSNVRVVLHDSFSRNFAKGVEASGATVQTIRDPAELMPDVYTSGVMDSRMTEEHSLAINTTKGLVVIVGCSHPGIVEIVGRFRETLNREIYAVLGGFHLMNESEQEVAAVIDQLKELGVQRCGASHCTGRKQIEMFKKAFGDNYIAMGAGQVISL